MADVTETQLPGVGVRYDFTTADGSRVGVLHHHSGRREIVVFGRDDPDSATSVVQLEEADARVLTDLLGATQVTEAIGAATQQRIEGLLIDWIEVQDGSPAAGQSIGQNQLRTRTGASVVAVVGRTGTEPAPGPEHVLEPSAVVVAVGTPDGLAELRRLLIG